MASITNERVLEVDAEQAWAALRDWEGLQERLVRGPVVDTRMEDGDRILTFSNGMVARERLVDLDERRRRLVWTVVGGPFAHYNGAAQVLPGEDGQTRFVWTSDLLPDELAGAVAEMMQEGIEAIQRTLRASGVRS